MVITAAADRAAWADHTAGAPGRLRPARRRVVVVVGQPLLPGPDRGRLPRAPATPSPRRAAATPAAVPIPSPRSCRRSGSPARTPGSPAGSSCTARDGRSGPRSPNSAPGCGLIRDGASTTCRPATTRCVKPRRRWRSSCSTDDLPSPRGQADDMSPPSRCAQPGHMDKPDLTPDHPPTRRRARRDARAARRAGGGRPRRRRRRTPRPPPPSAPQYAGHPRAAAPPAGGAPGRRSTARVSGLMSSLAATVLAAVVRPSRRSGSARRC